MMIIFTTGLSSNLKSQQYLPSRPEKEIPRLLESSVNPPLEAEIAAKMDLIREKNIWNDY